MRRESSLTGLDTEPCTINNNKTGRVLWEKMMSGISFF